MSRASNKSLLDLNGVKNQNIMKGSQASINSYSKSKPNSVSGLNTAYIVETKETSLIQGLNTKEPTEYILPKRESAEQLKLPAVKQAQAVDKDERNSIHSNNSSNSKLLKPNSNAKFGITSVTTNKTNGATTNSLSQPPSSKNASRAEDLKLTTDSTASLSIHLADSSSEVDRNSPKKTEFLNENSTRSQKEVVTQNNQNNKKNNKPDPLPKKNGKPEPTPRQNGKTGPSPILDEKKATLKPNNKPEPTPRQKGKPEVTPRDKPDNKKSPAKSPDKGPAKAPAEKAATGGKPQGKERKQEEDMRRNNQATEAMAFGKNQAQNPFGIHPWIGYNPWMYPWAHPQAHPVAALQNYHMNLWMKPYVQEWQQGKNQEELPFYFGLENSSYIHKWKTTDEGKQAVAKLEAKEAKEQIKKEKAEKAEQLKIEKAEKAKIAEQKKKEKAEKLAKEKELEAEKAAKEAEEKAKEAAETKAKAEAGKLDKAEQLKREKIKEAEEKTKAKEAKAKEAEAKKAEADVKSRRADSKADPKVKDTHPNKTTSDAKSPSDISKQTTAEEKKQGTLLPVIRKASNEPVKKGTANSNRNSVVSLPKDINKINDSMGKKSSQAVLVESIADFNNSTPRTSQAIESKKNDNISAEVTKTITNKPNANARSVNQNNAASLNGNIKPAAKSLNIVAKPSNNLAPKPSVQAQPIKS